MVRINSGKKPTFLWQAALILLPVAALATVAFFSLRQDKILAQHEASERAQAIADDLLPKLWNELASMRGTDQSESAAFQVNPLGQLLFPPPVAAVPTPKPFDLSELDPEQKKLWQLAQNAESGMQNRASTTQNWREFITLNSPHRFAAAARYTLGLALANQNQTEAAAEMFESVSARYPLAEGESGLPLQPLAQLKLLEILEATTNRLATRISLSVESFCSNAVYHPTALTPYLLKMASSREDTQKWLRLWEKQELSRQLFSSASPHLRTNGNLNPFWFHTQLQSGEIETEDQSWLALPIAATSGSSTRAVPEHFNSNRNSLQPRSKVDIPDADVQGLSERQPTASYDPYYATKNSFGLALGSPVSHPAEIVADHWFICRAESEVISSLTAVLNSAKQIPEYFGIGIELGGRQLPLPVSDLRIWHYYHHGGKGGGDRKEYVSALVTNIVIATNILASATEREQGADLLKVNVYLTSPTTLFQRQRTRTFWFGSLIAISAAAALIGLLTAWRAFHHQQQLSEMKSNFVSSVSHELRAPIASVRLMAESLERGKIPETARQNDYFRFIGQECRRLSSLIENILDFSRIEQGRKQYDVEPTDLAALTRQTVKLMESYAAEKQIILSLALPEPEGSNRNREASVDPRAIQQALVNLIDNAIKHSRKGQTVTVGLQSVEDRLSGEDTEASSRAGPLPNTRHSTLVTLSVEDHGDGIPPEEQEKIFQRFYRRGSELRRETQGVGIGLSIVKNIVEAHGGRVLVRSAVGQGSRFTIELPIENHG